MGFFKKVAKVTGISSASSALKKAVSTVAKTVSKTKSKSAPASKGIQAFLPKEKDKFKLFNSSDVQKFLNPEFENYSRKFSNSEPDILFVAEYILDDKSYGALVVWERFLDATHYEVFKKNIFQADGKFERVLFLDAQSLEEETKHFVDYLQGTLGIDLEEDKIFVMLDTVVKEDRIYEYKVKAARVPRKSTEVDYDFILESKGLTKQVVLDQTNTSTIFDFAGFVLGTKTLAWTISILNEKVPFFGRGAVEKSLVSLNLDRNKENEEYVLVANNINDILNVVNDSIALFGVKDTFRHLLRVLGGLGSDFRDAFIDSIDETRNVFSYDNFREAMKKKIPILSLSLTLAQSKNTAAIVELSKLSIVIPAETGSKPFSSIEDISRAINFVNDFFVAALYSQDKSEKVKEIVTKLATGQLQSSSSTDAAAKSLVSPTTETSVSSSSASTKITAKGSSAAIGAPQSTSTKTASTVTPTAKGSLAAAAQAAKNAATSSAQQRSQQQQAANKAKSKAIADRKKKEKEDKNKKIKIYF